MKLRALYAFFALSVAGLIVAGCQSSGGSNALPGTNATQGAPDSATAETNRISPDHDGSCGGDNAIRLDHGSNGPPCAPVVVTGLNFDGTTFSLPSNGCGFEGLRGTTPYAAPTSGPLTLSGSVSVTPTCVPSPLPSANAQLYIVAIQIPSWSGRRHHDAAIPAWGNGGGRQPGITLIAGPAALSANPWSFAPLGLTMQSGSKYIFAVVAVPAPPSPTPSGSPSAQPSTAPIQFVVAQLSFDGTNFTVPSTGNPCGFRGFGDAQLYTAPTSGPLVLSGSVSIAPTCVPSPLPSASALPPLYIVAVQVPGRGRHDSHRGSGDWHGPSFEAAEIAGPSALNASPWSFAPLSPGLTMTAGTKYIFFVATLRQPRPSPQPSNSPSPIPSESASPAPSPSPT